MSATTTAHVWRPSTARRVVLDGFAPVPRGTAPTAPAPLIWPPKDPADVLDYEFDISAALTGNEADGIAQITIAPLANTAGGFAVTSAVADGALAIFWIAGGQAGTTYAVQVSITTLSGRTINRALLLPVLSLASATIPSSALTTDSGVAVTDQNGNPILLGN